MNYQSFLGTPDFVRFCDELELKLCEIIPERLPGAAFRRQWIDKLQGESYLSFTINPKDSAIGINLNVSDLYAKEVKAEGMVSAARVRSIASEMLEKANRQNPEAAKRILIKGDAEVSLEAANVFAASHISLLGNESQTVGPEDATMEVHLILLGAGVVLLEGVRLTAVSEGVYFLNAAPLNLSGADGSPCRAILIAFEQ